MGASGGARLRTRRGGIYCGGQQGIQQPFPGRRGIRRAGRQAVAQGQQFVHFGDDALLFGQRREEAHVATQSFTCKVFDRCTSEILSLFAAQLRQRSRSGMGER